MKPIWTIVLGIIALFLFWGLIKFVIAWAIGTAIKVAVIALFVYIVYAVYKATTRQKAVY